MLLLPVLAWAMAALAGAQAQSTRWTTDQVGGTT
jgi:hypothetical protein